MAWITSDGVEATYTRFTVDERYESVKLTQLILKLVEIGQASRQDTPIVRNLVIEAEDFALALQLEVIALRREVEHLRSSATHL